MDSKNYYFHDKDGLIEALVAASDKTEGFGTLQKALDDFLDADVSHAAVNSKRAQSVAQILMRTDVQEMAVVTYYLSHPLEVATNSLLQRSSDQSELHIQLEFKSDGVGNCSHAQDFFLRYVDGSWGTSLVRDYVNLLDSGIQHMMYITNASLTSTMVEYFFKNANQP